MKLRRVFAHALLSLLLVASQQLGVFHALSHVAQRAAGAQQSLPAPASTLADGGTGTGADTGADAVRPASAVDIGCDQCLAFAQIGALLATSIPAISSDRGATPLYAPPAPASHRLRALSAFRSRAPPRLS